MSRDSSARASGIECLAASELEDLETTPPRRRCVVGMSDPQHSAPDDAPRFLHKSPSNETT